MIQGLFRKGVLGQIDYMSTVSGGGFVGSCLSSILSHHPSAFPFADQGGRESPVVGYLRRNANYLLPRGFLQRLQGLAVLLRGIVLNLLVLLPVLLAAALLTVLAYGRPLHDFERWAAFEPKLSDEELALPSLLNELAQLLPDKSPLFRSELVKQLEQQGLAKTVTEPNDNTWQLPGTEQHFHLVSSSDETLRRVLRRFIVPTADSTWQPGALDLKYSKTLFWIALLWIALLPLFTLVWKSIYRRRHWQSVGWRNFYEKSYTWVLVLLGLAALIEVQPYLVYRFHQLTKDESSRLPYGLLALIVFVVLLTSGAAIYSRLGKIGRALTLGLVATVTLALPFLGYLVLVEGTVYSNLLSTENSPLDTVVAFFFFLILILLALIPTLFLDTNSASLLAFYRERLSRALLVGRLWPRGAAPTAEIGTAPPVEDLRLSELCPPESGAAYQILNCTLNLQGSRSSGLGEPSSDLFVFSPRYVGGRRCGYCRTRTLEDIFPFAHLGTAMAVSGAALAPNMGVVGKRGLAVLLTMLNIRLGYWLPNPAWVNRRVENRPERGFWRRAVDRILFHPRASLLLREALGWLNESGSHVNVSDGGHMENTGVYQLLRRRCRYIIACDAEADPKRRFTGFMALMLYARLDLGVKIDIDLDALRVDERGTSQRHWAVGRVCYPECDEAGYLLYVKTSVTGDEHEIVNGYRALHPDFPHEPTADQFFSKAQFEAYRDLGEHAVDGLPGDIAAPSGEGVQVDNANLEIGSWFQALAAAGGSGD